MLKDRLQSMLHTGDRKAWREFLNTSTLQEATYAHVLASSARIEDMSTLAFKRAEHLNGEHRHIDLWR